MLVSEQSNDESRHDSDVSEQGNSGSSPPVSRRSNSSENDLSDGIHSDYELPTENEGCCIHNTDGTCIDSLRLFIFIV